MTHTIYKVVEEWSAPTYYDYDTREELYDECDSSCQRLVAGGGYDTDTIKNTKIVLTWGVV